MFADTLAPPVLGVTECCCPSPPPTSCRPGPLVGCLPRYVLGLWRRGLSLSPWSPITITFSGKPPQTSYGKSNRATTLLKMLQCISIYWRVKYRIINHSPQGPAWRDPCQSSFNSLPILHSIHVSCRPGVSMEARNTNALITTRSLAHCLKHSRLCLLVIPLSASDKQCFQPNVIYSSFIKKFEGRLCQDWFISSGRPPGTH